MPTSWTAQLKAIQRHVIAAELFFILSPEQPSSLVGFEIFSAGVTLNACLINYLGKTLNSGFYKFVVILVLDGLVQPVSEIG